MRRFFDDHRVPVIPKGDPGFEYFMWRLGCDTPSVRQVALDTAAVVLGVAKQSGSASTPKQWKERRRKVEARLRKGR